MSKTSQKNVKTSFYDEGEAEALNFFENKAAPKYWQVFYDLLKSKSKIIAVTIITCSFIFTLPQIISSIGAQSQTFISFIKEKQALQNEKNKIIEKDKLNFLENSNLQAIRKEINLIRAPYDELYAETQPYFIKLSTYNSEREIAYQAHRTFNEDFNETFEKVFKLVAVLEAQTPSAYATISTKEILSAIETLRRERLSNFSLNHPSYNKMLVIYQTYKK